ncbi:MAG TPA: ATP-grasp fold amidoligase family protein [Acidimicrobiales bacterium]|nr:ATP-grasp fold amidoligase family protein [Acidimicrobiales bacterium]
MSTILRKTRSPADTCDARAASWSRGRRQRTSVNLERLGRHARFRVLQLGRWTRLPLEVRVRLLYWTHHPWRLSRRPASFNEKLRWKMVKDRRPLLTTFADKVAVRQYVASAVGPEVLAESYAVVDDPVELDRHRLPREFVVKANHASGTVFIVTDPDRFPGDLPSSDGKLGQNSVIASCDDLDWDLLVATCRRWLSHDYARWVGEWPYRDVPRKLLVEELLTGPGGTLPPSDYKFYVFHGRVRLLEVHTDRYTDHRANLFLPDWSPVEADLAFPRAEQEIPRPLQLEQMIGMAQALGRDTDFVRVDLYDIGGRIVFGELTNYPEGGLGEFKPRWFDEHLGGWWTLPRRYG